MAGGSARQRAQAAEASKVRKQKIFIGIGGGLLLVVVGFQLFPALLGGSSSSTGSSPGSTQLVPAASAAVPIASASGGGSARGRQRLAHPAIDRASSRRVTCSSRRSRHASGCERSARSRRTPEGTAGSAQALRRQGSSSSPRSSRPSRRRPSTAVASSGQGSGTRVARARRRAAATSSSSPRSRGSRRRAQQAAATCSSSRRRTPG